MQTSPSGVDERNFVMDSKTKPGADIANFPMGTSVPKIIHQIFLDGFSKLPVEIHKSIEAMRALNPEWEYRLYDAETAELFIKEHYGEGMLRAYLKIDRLYYAARADFLRYLICYAEGGVYMDIKSRARRPLNDVLRSDDTFLLSQWNDMKDIDPYQTSHPAAHAELRHVKGFEYVQWFVVSARGHPFLKAVIAQVLDNIDRYRPLQGEVGRKGVLKLTGPIAYTLAIDPLRASVPHRFVDFEDDLAFAFSTYGDHKKHRATLGLHYSEFIRPVVLKGPVTTAATCAWFGTIKPKIQRLKWRLGLS